MILTIFSTLIGLLVGGLISWKVTKHYFDKSPQVDDIKKAVQEGISEDVKVEINSSLQEMQKTVETALKRPMTKQIILIDDILKTAQKLDFIRRTLQPRTEGRIPFHNDAEVALRGYHAGSFRESTPSLNNVTWEKVPYKDENLHRGYNAAIIFKGHNFAPGVVWTNRRKGENIPVGRKDYWWQEPNIYWGDYLEVSVGDDPEESPLSLHGYEFKVKNPNGKESEWVEFYYPLDIDLLLRKAEAYFEQGKRLYESGKIKDAFEPLRKAYVYRDRLLGKEDSKTLEAFTVFDDCKQKCNN